MNDKSKDNPNVMKARLKRQRHSIIKAAYTFSFGKEIWSEATFPSIIFCHRSYKVLSCNVCAFVQLFGNNADKPIKPRQCGNRIRSLMVKSFTVTTWSGKKMGESQFCFGKRTFSKWISFWVDTYLISAIFPLHISLSQRSHSQPAGKSLLPCWLCST